MLAHAGRRSRHLSSCVQQTPGHRLADEPTANLDSQTGAAVIQLMRRMQASFRISFLFSSHDRNLMNAADDLVTLRDGEVQSIRRRRGTMVVDGDSASDTLMDGLLSHG